MLTLYNINKTSQNFQPRKISKLENRINVFEFCELFVCIATAFYLRAIKNCIVNYSILVLN